MFFNSLKSHVLCYMVNVDRDMWMSGSIGVIVTENLVRLTQEQKSLSKKITAISIEKS